MSGIATTKRVVSAEIGDGQIQIEIDFDGNSGNEFLLAVKGIPEGAAISLAPTEIRQLAHALNECVARL